MKNFYRLLIKAPLVAALLLVILTAGISFSLGTTALIPMIVLAIASGAYAGSRLGQTSH